MSKVRLNIYVTDPAIRKQVEAAATQHDTTVSDYCLQAILAKLREESESALKGHGPSLAVAVQRARRFQTKAFPGQIFSTTSAKLIAQARRERASQQ